MMDTTIVPQHETLGRDTGVAFATLTTSSAMPTRPGAESLALLKESIRANATVSFSQNFLDARQMSQAMRVAQIRALRGKYQHMLTPSDEFARRKQEEIALESGAQ
jgi:hypothetical protein